MKKMLILLCMFFLTCTLPQKDFGCTLEEEEPYSEVYSKEEIRRIINKRKQVLAELKRLRNHPWAGHYYFGDGLACNFDLFLAPKNGFVFTGSSCTGLQGRDDGPVVWKNDRIKLTLSSDHGSLDPPLVSEYFPIRWKDRLYLIPEEKLVDFFDEIDSQKEPRSDPYGSFYLRDGDWEKEVDGKPIIPPKYQIYLRKNTVDVTIVSLGPTTEVQEDIGTLRTSVIIDKGKNAKLFSNMKLFVDDDPQKTCEPVVLIKVDAEIAEGYYEYYNESKKPQVGWKLSTYPSWRRNR